MTPTTERSLWLFPSFRKLWIPRTLFQPCSFLQTTSAFRVPTSHEIQKYTNTEKAAFHAVLSEALGTHCRARWAYIRTLCIHFYRWQRLSCCVGMTRVIASRVRSEDDTTKFGCQCWISFHTKEEREYRFLYIIWAAWIMRRKVQPLVSLTRSALGCKSHRRHDRFYILALQPRRLLCPSFFRLLASFNPSRFILPFPYAVAFPSRRFYAASSSSPHAPHIYISLCFCIS